MHNGSAVQSGLLILVRLLQRFSLVIPVAEPAQFLTCFLVFSSALCAGWEISMLGAFPHVAFSISGVVTIWEPLWRPTLVTFFCVVFLCLHVRRLVA